MPTSPTYTPLVPRPGCSTDSGGDGFTESDLEDEEQAEALPFVTTSDGGGGGDSSEEVGMWLSGAMATPNGQQYITPASHATGAHSSYLSGVLNYLSDTNDFGPNPVNGGLDSISMEPRNTNTILFSLGYSDIDVRRALRVARFDHALARDILQEFCRPQDVGDV
ncbi:unnamed protein product [Protopolystoma xenopodis]|uniref:UBA domain-containing protein n=1 Tax=Protopolystoma xenopodis TaxID=117903 RepID=A0A3S5A0N3_9PLAT|nr:unnamed protein product [Protopolystoma xenopodis]